MGRRLIGGVALILGAYALMLLASGGSPARSASFSAPTYSSPIAMSRDGRYVWSVNPDADTVSVIRTSSNSVVATIRVGNEPQGVALDPNNRYAFVANAAASTVTVIRIRSASGSFRPRVDRSIGRNGHLVTGSEPWNIVASPDGRRVFVANSGQDTITVLDAQRPRIIGHVDVRRSVCSGADRSRHFQPRGMAVTRQSTRLYVTSFLAFTRPGGRQGDDNGKEGVVCRLRINTKSNRIRDYRPAARIAIPASVTGFKIDSSGDGVPDDTTAFPNQLQSIVIRNNTAYVPNVAASPDGPLRFNVDTQAFLSPIDGIREPQERAGGAGLLHLAARDPEPGKKKLFFASPWAVAFTNQGGAGAGYVVSQGSDLLVKLFVAGDGKLAFTVDGDTTRYIDLNDPANPATSGGNAGKNPQGIVINRAGTRAYVANFVSRNVSVVDLANDRVIGAIRTAALPAPGSQEEIAHAGAEMFFSSRGNFNRPPGALVSTSERLSSEGWQSCSSCHFKGLTDGVVWEFGAGPRKSVPLNSTFNPRNRTDQRVLNYSAIFDEIEDFELNIRNVSGPGPLAAPAVCSDPPPPTSTFDPTHGLLWGDASFNFGPCVVNAFAKPNANRNQVTLTPPGSTAQIPALTALREWVRLAVRTPNGPVSSRSVSGGLNLADVAQGRTLFQNAGCASCHGGGKWTTSTKDFASPPAAAEIATETTPPPPAPLNPVPVQYLNRFLRDVGSFNRGVPGTGNELGANVGADEKASAAVVAGVAGPRPDGLGVDFNGDGKGTGFNVPSLLGILAVPPYYHNGACESLACVVDDVKHRTANGTRPDGLTTARQRELVVLFLRSISGATQPFP
jgi:YVTN family beta-propeller protein